ncbi:MAG: hypothetical protein K6F23_15250 [Solobacterium sp.]|nr:hypothetical protein [Solobacterium sp.]
MHRYETTRSFVLTLEADIKDCEFIEKYFRILDQIYNGCLDTALKRLHRLQMDPEYQMLVKNKSVPGRNKKIHQKQIEYGYTEYQFHEKAAEMKHHFSDTVGIDECQKQATKAFRAVEKIRFHEADRVRHHSVYDDTSVEGKSKNSALNYRNGLLYIGRKHKYEVTVKPGDAYAEEALRSSRLKYVRLTRKTIRGKTRYFVQLVLRGIPPKKHEYGSEETVTGLDIGVSTVAEVSSEHVQLHALAPEIPETDAEIRRISRAMDRSRRASNPSNYKDDGSILRGKLKWKYSGRYRKLRAKRRELYRKRAASLKESHEKLANEMLERSTCIICETMNYRALQKRSKKTSVNQKNGRYNRKSRFGKALANHAPSMFEAILDRKLHYIGKELIHTDTSKICASQINHATGEKVKKDLSVRTFEIEGIMVQRDLYSAFITGHTAYSSKDSEKPDTVDYESCAADFEHYIVLQKKELKRLQETGKLSWYIS